MGERVLKTPVLFIIFNRPDTTRAVFEVIKKARPAKLFIAADGPRPDRQGEADLCALAKEIVSHVTWDCEVFTLYRDINLGCKDAISSAISWFFNNVEEGIILEDDCLPDHSFFYFCEELLQYYRNDERVMTITGTSYLFNKITASESYFFSRYFSVWGWATWRRAWKLYDITMADWPKFKELHYLESLYPEPWVAEYFTSEFQDTYEGTIVTWDHQWFYSIIFNHGLCVTPINNLITNIGVNGTHFNGSSKMLFMPIKSVDADNLIHPERVMPDMNLDRLNMDSMIKKVLEIPDENIEMSKAKTPLLYKILKLIRRPFRG